MSKMGFLFCSLNQGNCRLSPAEKILLEVKLFIHLYHELSDIFMSRYMGYQKLIKYDQEKNMNGIKFMQEVIKDILSTEEYSLAGIANYTRIPEDVLSDIAAGMNANPTLELSRKLFELHVTVRRELYDRIMRKFASKYLMPA